MTESIANLKKDMKSNENPQKDPHEYETKTSRTSSYNTFWFETGIKGECFQEDK